MSKIQKLSIGVQPFSKMFRVHGLAGAATDAILALRGKELPDSFFDEVGVNAERTAYRLTGLDQVNALRITETDIVFSKDHYESDVPFNMRKTLDEFRILWNAANSVLSVADIRRIGIVAEYRMSVPHKHPSVWLRNKLTSLPSENVTDKFSLRFEERKFAADGIAPDPKKSDFINTIYSYYDSSTDDSHASPGFINVNLDVQRYFAPMLKGGVPDELTKLLKHFEAAEARLAESLSKMGAVDGKA